jgi:hypothetical protein
MWSAMNFSAEPQALTSHLNAMQSSQCHKALVLFQEVYFEMTIIFINKSDSAINWLAIYFTSHYVFLWCSCQKNCHFFQSFFRTIADLSKRANQTVYYQLLNQKLRSKVIVENISLRKSSIIWSFLFCYVYIKFISLKIHYKSSFLNGKTQFCSAFP